MATNLHILAAACLAILAGTVATHAQGTAKIVRDCPTCPEMVQIPAGSFTMGVSAEEEKREGSDTPESTPQHIVTVPRDFLMGRYAVTVEEFAAFVSATDFKTGDDCVGNGDGTKTWRSPGFRQTDRDPVVCLNVADAQAYVDWLSKKTGKTYRLPSEAEWEYAARAGTKTARFWGDDRDSACKFANVADRTLATETKGTATDAGRYVQCSDGFAYTAPVGSFQPNGFGLYDMLGNAWQWTNDCWNENYIGAPLDGSAWEKGDCGRQVMRGGSWDDFPELVRAGQRYHDAVGYRDVYTGFRVSRPL